MARMNSLSDKTTNILKLRKRIRKFVDDREWKGYHNPKNLAMSIAIETSELMEIFQWISDEELATMMKSTNSLARVEEELADIIIYCLSLANAVDVDVTQAVIKKIEQNENKYPIEQIKGNYKKYTQI